MKKREINNNNKLKIVLVFGFFENSVVREYTWLIVCNYLYWFFQKRWNELNCLLGLHLNFKFTHCTATKLEVEIVISKSPVGSLYWCLLIGIFSDASSYFGFHSDNVTLFNVYDKLRGLYCSIPMFCIFNILLKSFLWS